MQSYRAQNVELSPRLIKIQKMIVSTINFGMMLWSKVFVAGFVAGEKERKAY